MISTLDNSDTSPHLYIRLVQTVTCFTSNTLRLYGRLFSTDDITWTVFGQENFVIEFMFAGQNYCQSSLLGGWEAKVPRFCLQMLYYELTIKRPKLTPLRQAWIC